MCDINFILWFIAEKSKIIMHKYFSQIWYVSGRWRFMNEINAERKIIPKHFSVRRSLGLWINK